VLVVDSPVDPATALDFSGQTVLVTGGTRGLGRVICRTFLDAGADVVTCARNTPTEPVVSSDGSRSATFVAADVRDADQVGAVVAAAVDQTGRLDVLVNNAGGGFSGPMEEMTEAKWDNALDVNLKSTFFCVKAALPALRMSRGNIVNVASAAGLMGLPGTIVYCAAKGAVVNMTKAMALAFAPDVRVNCVCPGYVDTDMVRRDGIEAAADPAAAEQALLDYSPLEIATAIAYLAHADTRFITGAALQIDGGITAGR
jgi:NAD(P)-dependent dehydrogenase (short-subunit alcohol dehydrogenase family)